MKKLQFMFMGTLMLALMTTGCRATTAIEQKWPVMEVVSLSLIVEQVLIPVEYIKITQEEA